MNAQEAYDDLEPDAWAQTPAQERLALIEEVQANLRMYGKELGRADAAMKNRLIGETVQTDAVGVFSTVGPIAAMLVGAQNLWEAISRARC